MTDEPEVNSPFERVWADYTRNPTTVNASIQVCRHFFEAGQAAAADELRAARLESLGRLTGWNEANKRIRELLAAAPRAGVVDPADWPVAKDGPHKITDERLWLARKLVDSKLSDKEAFSCVRHHPDISGSAVPDPSAAPGHTDLMVAPESIDAFMEANPLPTDWIGELVAAAYAFKAADEAHCGASIVDWRPELEAIRSEATSDLLRAAERLPDRDGGAE